MSREEEDEEGEGLVAEADRPAAVVDCHAAVATATAGIGRSDMMAEGFYVGGDFRKLLKGY